MILRSGRTACTNVDLWSLDFDGDDGADGRSPVASDDVTGTRCRIRSTSRESRTIILSRCQPGNGGGAAACRTGTPSQRLRRSGQVKGHGLPSPPPLPSCGRDCCWRIP